MIMVSRNTEREGERERRERERESYSLPKEPIGCVNPHAAESDFWPTMPSREQRGYQKSYPFRDRYYVGCLGQTRV